MQFADSKEANIPQLDLFTLPKTQTTIAKQQWYEYRPVNSSDYTNTPCDFIIPGNSVDVIDLSRSYLYLHLKVVKQDGSDVGADDKVGIVNNILHSMWSQVDVFLNQQLISSSTRDYQYKSYIDTVLFNDKSTKETRLQTSGFYKDSGDIESTDVLTGTNLGLTEIYSLVSASRGAYFYGPLLADITQVDRYILGGVDVHLRLWPSNQKFNLVKPATIVGDFKIKILDIAYHVCKLNLTPDFLLGQDTMLKKHNALYPYKRSRIQTFAIPTGSYVFIETNLFQFERCQQVIVGFLKSEAYQGSYTKKPFNFVDATLSEIALFVDDIACPFSPIQCNFSKREYAELYYNMFSNIGIDKEDKGNFIDYEDFRNGYTLMCFDISGGYSRDTLSIIKPATLRIEARFKDALTEPLTAVVYGRFNDVFQIDSVRNIVPRTL